MFLQSCSSLQFSITCSYAQSIESEMCVDSYRTVFVSLKKRFSVDRSSYMAPKMFSLFETNKCL